MDKYFKAIDRNDWVRNPQWLQFPDDDDLDNKAYYLVAVFEDSANIISVSTFNIINVDWGDGTVDSSPSVVVSHTYDYATLSSTVLTYEDGRNYKMAVIEFTSDQSSDRCQLLDSVDNNADNNVLDAEFRFSGINTGASDPNSYTFRFGSSNKQAIYLERIKAKYPVNAVGFTRGLRSCVRLEVLDVPSDFFNYMSIGNNNLFEATSSLAKNPPVYPDINFTGLTGTTLSLWRNSSRAILGNLTIPNITEATSGCIHGQVLKCGNLSLPLATKVNFFFGGTVGKSLSGGIGTIDIPVADDIRTMFRNCFMSEVVFIDLTAVTNATDIFLDTGNISKLITPNLTVGIDVSVNKMTATAINDFFTSLGTANGTQTVNVSSNPGAATCDTTIATNKGWTVVT